MIVIDVGCARYGADYSIERLLEEFDPDALYGFDPNWQASMFHPPADLRALIIASNEAAWTFDGKIGFQVDGLNSCLSYHHDAVPCIDLAREIRELPDDAEIILKLDCEGSEYELLEHLMAKGVDERLSLLWIEWHDFGIPDPGARRATLERRLRCPVEKWRW